MFVFNGGPTETQALCKVVTEDGIPRASDQRPSGHDVRCPSIERQNRPDSISKGI
jgi:hypothetical protein